jgi:hypothetical protein
VEEESGIPALYTYFGQFIGHDISFDRASGPQKRNDPEALIDFRTPAIDLDSVYGWDPDDQPYMYDGGIGQFLLGEPLAGGDPNARDLPRDSANPARALIADRRNDENAIISQLQGLFLRFHNRIAADNPDLSFPEVQRLVRFHYQYVVLNDFLPRVIHSMVLEPLQTEGVYDAMKLKFYRYRYDAFIPVEFSAAAYLFGHSMVRPGYRLNDHTLLPLLPMPWQGFPEALTGFRAMIPTWGIDWGRFIDIDVRTYDGSFEDNQRRLQFAYRIDTSLVNVLSALPASDAGDPSSQPLRNLERGYRLGLPTGQQVAKAMRVRPLPDDRILIGKADDDPAEPPVRITEISPVFAGNCPLWTYILAEAMQFKQAVTIPVKECVQITTPQLGPVGGRIVAEVFLGLMFADGNSMLRQDPDWTPAEGADYSLKDFVAYALGLDAAKPAVGGATDSSFWLPVYRSLG